MNKVFISWSGEPSRTVGLALKRWLPSVMHTIEPWMSQEDIKPGSRWGAEISHALAEIHFGVICVTEINQSSPWLSFEAGALAKTLDMGRVCPYLVRLLPTKLVGPLSQFQSVRADKNGTLQLVLSINESIEQRLDPQRLKESFDKWWPDFDEVLNNLPEPSKETTASSEEWPLVKTAQSLAKRMSSLSLTQRKLFREILKSDNRILKNAFKEFFNRPNTIGGYSGDGLYPNMLSELLELGRDEIIYRCRDLERDELIVIHDLSDKCFRATESVIRVTNNQPQIVLSSVYSAEEQNNPPIEEHHGRISYSNGKPDVFIDGEERPLEGVFKVTFGAVPGIYVFKNGRITGNQDRLSRPKKPDGKISDVEGREPKT